MRVRLLPPNAQDEFFLIRVEVFKLVVDDIDLAERNSQNIEDAYHEHWLSSCSDGSYLFRAPEFYLTQGKARFINGRHRMLVLSRHLAQIPMALANMDGYPVRATQPTSISERVLSKLAVRRTTKEEVFLFPDLPIRYLGYDVNIGK